ncbi:hypothetical protein C8J56DRAFT_318461 [Mycena floridula]|nr:hypothetical protein C8J56DRAFT_318461 [Mycena floridula]
MRLLPSLCRRYLSTSPLLRSDLKSRIQAKIAAVDAISPVLIDSFHRRHDYLRISLTERACHSEKGLSMLMPT